MLFGRRSGILVWLCPALVGPTWLLRVVLSPGVGGFHHLSLVGSLALSLCRAGLTRRPCFLLAVCFFFLPLTDALRPLQPVWDRTMMGWRTGAPHIIGVTVLSRRGEAEPRALFLAQVLCPVWRRTTVLLGLASNSGLTQGPSCLSFPCNCEEGRTWAWLTL